MLQYYSNFEYLDNFGLIDVEDFWGKMCVFCILQSFTKAGVIALSPRSWVNKVSLQTILERNFLNLSFIFLLNVKFENLTVRLHVLYIFNMHVKFIKNKYYFLFNQ